MKKKQKQVNPSKQVFSTTINSLSHDGRGIASSPKGKTIFIDGALPGEEVTYKLTKKHKTYDEGSIVEIITSSPTRVKPPCLHYAVCGGCSMQHINIDAQIAFKQQVLLEQLQHFGRVQPDSLAPPINATSWGYRRKARLGVRYLPKENKVIVGFRQKASQTLAELHSCLVMHNSVGLHLAELAQVLSSLSQREHIPQIEIAIGDTSSVLVFRHLTTLSAEDLEKLCNFGKKHQLAIYLQPNPPAKIHKIWPDNQDILLKYALTEFDLDMLFEAQDFTQINGEINPLMVSQALHWLAPEPTDRVLDLFCGLGNFTLPIARKAQLAVGVEGSLEMVSRAQSNASHNQITNTEFYAANLDILPASKPAWMKKSYDKILLDPPRTGAKNIISIFPKFAAKRIVYVSCNPATLARDAGELVHKQGYQLKKIGVINMFPHTSHIEAMALFEKAKT